MESSCLDSNLGFCHLHSLLTALRQLRNLSMDWFLVADIKELLVIVRHDNGMAVTLKKMSLSNREKM